MLVGVTPGSLQVGMDSFHFKKKRSFCLKITKYKRKTKQTIVFKIKNKKSFLVLVYRG